MLINVPNDHGYAVNPDALGSKYASPSSHQLSSHQLTHKDLSFQELLVSSENSNELADSITYWVADLLDPPAQVSKSFSTSLPQAHPLTELQRLQQAANLGEQQKNRGYSICKEAVSNYPERVGNYADPISPLRERDLQALSELFYRDDIRDIETDITQMLLNLLPEPCWEENLFEFLREFL